MDNVARRPRVNRFGVNLGDLGHPFREGFGVGVGVIIASGMERPVDNIHDQVIVKPQPPGVAIDPGGSLGLGCQHLKHIGDPLFSTLAGAFPGTRHPGIVLVLGQNRL